MSQQLFTKKVIDRALKDKPWVTKHGKKYRVVPRRQFDGRIEHGKYELSYVWNGDVPEVTSCTDWRTGLGCRGFTYSKQCYHAFSLLRKLMIYRMRKDNEAQNVIVFPLVNERGRNARL